MKRTWKLGWQRRLLIGREYRGRDVSRMKTQGHEKPRTKGPEPDSVRVPPGAPSWITAELIRETLHVWQPYYEEPLVAEDALEMLMNVGQLFKTLSSKGK